MENSIKVQKRNGNVVEFDILKIQKAVFKAILDVNEYDTEKTLQEMQFCQDISDKVYDTIVKTQKEPIHIEKIQNIVEHKLMCSSRKDVAQSYIRYRQRREEERNQIENLDLRVSEIVTMKGNKVNENANKDANVWSTKRDLLAGVVAQDYAWRHIMPKNIADAHTKGILHWHDSDYSPMFSMFNCMLINFKGMLSDGFCIGNADIDTPKGINTATALVAQIVANVSSNIYGGTSFNRVDEVLEPYAQMTYDKHLAIAKECIEDETKQIAYAKKMTIKSIYDAMQSLEYELNTLYNSNGQTPFVTLGFGLGTSWLAKEIQKAILKVRIEGLGASHKTPVFPKLIYVLKRGLNLNPEDPNYDIKQLALQCSVKRMYPDIENYDQVVKRTGGFKFCMGCRSYLSEYLDENGNPVHDGRMNLGVVTLNLVRIALETQSKEEYMKLLAERLVLAEQALKFRIHTLDEVKAKNAPILYMHGATGHRLKADDYVKDIFKDGYASISLGYIGLHEVATRFYGVNWQHNREAKQFTLDVLKALHDKTVELKKETGYGFSVYATPSEGLCDRFCRIDKATFGEIEHITDKEYYTNSFHYDVAANITPFEKIDFEKEYIQYTPGGFISYAEFPSLRKNTKALETYWDYCYDRVPYVGCNSPLDKCFKCGYEGEYLATETGFTCPNCGNSDPTTSNCIRRVCGYLGDPLQRGLNNGKLHEVQARVKHMKDNTQVQNQ